MVMGTMLDMVLMIVGAEIASMRMVVAVSMAMFMTTRLR